MHYHGKEITKAVISDIKKIARKRYDNNIYIKSYAKLQNVYDLEMLHGNHSYNGEDIILGEDWFINYSKTGALNILEWVSLEKSSDKMQQIKEMLMALKNIIKENENINIRANMRHDTSYKIYKKYRDNNYFFESYEWIFFDDQRPKKMQNWIDNIEEKYLTVEEGLNDKNLEIKEEYGKYIIHAVCFVPTKKLMKKIDKN